MTITLNCFLFAAISGTLHRYLRMESVSSLTFFNKSDARRSSGERILGESGLRLLVTSSSSWSRAKFNAVVLVDLKLKHLSKKEKKSNGFISVHRKY